MRQKWEYLVEGISTYQGTSIGIVKPNMPGDSVQPHLNKRGEEGWELIQFAGTQGDLRPGCDMNAPGMIFVFKRQKP